MSVKKIDLYFTGDYLCSTTQSKTCKEAIQNYLDRLNLRKDYLGTLESYIQKNPQGLKAYFDKGSK